MPGFPGFDTAEFPGIAEMAWLKANTNLVWCGYYLGPAPSHASTSWMGQRAGLQAAGWGVAPLYVGQQIEGPGRHLLSASQAGIDAAEAVRLLAAEGFANGTCIYLDVEGGPPFEPPRSDYVAAWADAVGQAGFSPGVYCSHAFAADLHGLRRDIRIWAVRVTTTDEHPFPGVNFPNIHPAGSGYAGAFAWQLAENCRLRLPVAPLKSPLVDLDTAVSPDPSIF